MQHACGLSQMRYPQFSKATTSCAALHSRKCVLASRCGSPAMHFVMHCGSRPLDASPFQVLWLEHVLIPSCLLISI